MMSPPLSMASKNEHAYGEQALESTSTSVPRDSTTGATANNVGRDEVTCGDSGTNGMQDPGEDNVDVQALSGVARLTMEPNAHPARTLATEAIEEDVNSIDDIVMSNDMQAVAGTDGISDEEDEDYSGVAALSDDGHSLVDGAEDELLKAAESDLIREFEKKEEYTRNKMVTLDVEANWIMESLVDGGSRDEEDPFGLDASYNWNDDPFNGASLFDSTWNDLAGSAETDFWNVPNAGFMQETTVQSNSRPKRVRFQEGVQRSRSPSQSSSDSSEDEADDQFPDIFMAQDDPKIQQLLSYDFNDGGLSGPGSDAGSVYDFEDDGDRFAFEVDQSSESSEYDTDSDLDDDTDDEDIDYETEDEPLEETKGKELETRKVIRPIARPTSSASAPATPLKSKSNKGKAPALARSHSADKASSPKARKLPRMGTFACDPTKATVVSDANGKTTVLYMPTKPPEKHKAFWERAKSAATSRESSPRGSMSLNLPFNSATDHVTPQRPFTAQSTLATMFDGNMDFMRYNDMTALHRQDLAKALVPVPSSTYSSGITTAANITVATTDEASEMEDDFTDFTMLVDMDPDSDTEDAPSPAGTTSPTKPTQPTFLSHGMVGSFRLNQHRAKEESSLASHPASRASTSESNALQSGRRGAGNAPITPARKKRTSKDMSFTGSGIRKSGPSAMSSPLARRNSRPKSRTGHLDHTLTPGFSGWK